MEIKVQRTTRVVIATATLAAVVLSSSGCGMIWPTRGRRGEPTHSGFLGDYSQLKKVEGYPAQEVYINPNAAWSSYNAIYIESVSLWVKDPAKVPAADRQMLTDMLYKAMHDKLGEKFTLVDHPAPGAIKLRMAFTEAQGATVPLNVITTAIPQIRVVATVAGLSSDTATLVGAASVEGEARDPITDERLSAAVDARAGTKGVTRMFSKWADVQAACDYWAERTTNFFVKQGVRTKS